MISERRAVKLIHSFAARFCVQSINVLRHDGGKNARALKLGELQVRRVRLNALAAKMLAVEFIEFLGVLHKKHVAEYLLGRVAVIHHIDAVRRAEIGDAALGRYACAAEKYGPFAAFDYVVQGFRLLFGYHGLTSPKLYHRAPAFARSKHKI